MNRKYFFSNMSDDPTARDHDDDSCACPTPNDLQTIIFISVTIASCLLSECCNPTLPSIIKTDMTLKLPSSEMLKKLLISDRGV